MTTIRRRLLGLVCAVWLPAAAGFGLLAWNTVDEQRAATQRLLVQHALGVRTVLERELNKRLTLARALAAAQALRDGDLARFHAEASRALEDAESWALLADPAWTLLDTRQPYPSTPVANAAAVPSADEHPRAVFTPPSAGASPAAITQYAPVDGPAGSRWFVGVSFEPSALQRIVESIPTPFDGLTVIVNDQHRIMARSRTPERYLGLAATDAFRALVEAGQSGFAVLTTLEGVTSLAYLAPPNTYGWTVAVSVPRATLTATTLRESAKATAAASMLLIIGLALAWIGARRLENPVRALEASAQRLADNEVPPPLRTGVREVDDVGRTLHAAGVRAADASAVQARRVAEAIRQTEAAQAQLLQSQKLEAIGRLTAGVSHDFNNLLQAIKVSLHVLGKRITDDASRRALDNATQATTKAGQLIGQLSSLGRVPSLAPTAVNVAELLSSGEALMRSGIGERIVLDLALDAALPAVLADRAQLEMALLNLVVNARDALPDGGRLSIRAVVADDETTRRRGWRERHYVRIDVIDDGTGIAPEVLARVFEPYFTTKPVGAGSGIGLAQVQSFARQSGGDVTLSSEVGRGTCASLYLPVAVASTDAPAPTAGDEPALAPPAPSEAPRPHARRVLMVEDDGLIASATLAALEAHGHAVQWCQSADDAIERLNGPVAFDLLFTDVVMPGRLDGLGLVDWCQHHRPGLPILVTTGYAERLEAIRVPVIRKPYDVDTLFATIERTIAGAAAGAITPPSPRASRP